MCRIFPKCETILEEKRATRLVIKNILQNQSLIVNPLIVFANAYDCYPSIDALRRLEKYDQLWINYVKYPINYQITERFFEENPQYTHIFYVAPDIVLDDYKFECLIKYVEQHDPPVYGGCCNVDKGKYENSLACCLKLPELDYINRRYRWVAESHRKFFLNNGTSVIKVKFNANFAFVRRDVKDKIKYMALPYKTDERPIHEQRGGFACDLAFCHFADSLGIDILVDLRYKFEHLRYAGKLQVGVKPPLIQFKSGGNTQDISNEYKDLLNG